MKAQTTDASKSNVLSIAAHLFTQRAEPVAERTARGFGGRSEASRIPNAGGCILRKPQ
jgi:hypothetical protein